MVSEAHSELMKSLNAKKFTFTGEIEPEKIADLGEVIETAKKLKGHVVAANVTDLPQSFAYMNSLVPSYIIQREVGLESIYQMVCRDRNRIALFGDLLAAGALEIVNVLALTGDHTSLGDCPEAMPVFDLDSASLVYLIRKMTDEGKDLNGNEIEHPPKFHVGIAANPGANPLELEILKIERKVKLGAEFMQTQVVYDIEKAREFIDEVAYLKIPTLIGVCPLKSPSVALWMDKYCPGISVPKGLIDQLLKAKEIEDKQRRREKYNEINIDYFGEFIRELKKTTKAAGCHIMAVGFEEVVKDIIAASGVK